MLNIFNGRATSPAYTLAAPPNGEVQTITVKKEVRIETEDDRAMLRLA